MINNNMLNGVASLIVGTATTIPAAMALGSVTGVLGSGDTITSGEFERAALTSKTAIGNLAKYVYLRSGATLSSTNTYINSVGLWNSTSGGLLWANMLMASVLQTTSFDLDLEFWVQTIGV